MQELVVSERKRREDDKNDKTYDNDDAGTRDNWGYFRDFRKDTTTRCSVKREYGFRLFIRSQPVCLPFGSGSVAGDPAAGNQEFFQGRAVVFSTSCQSGLERFGYGPLAEGKVPVCDLPAMRIPVMEPGVPVGIEILPLIPAGLPRFMTSTCEYTFTHADGEAEYSA